MMSDNNYTPEQLEKMLSGIDAEIAKSNKRIAHHWATLFTPPKADTKVQHWINQAERAVAVYDGFMLMYKLFNRFSFLKSTFKRKKQKQ